MNRSRNTGLTAFCLAVLCVLPCAELLAQRGRGGGGRGGMSRGGGMSMSRGGGMSAGRGGSFSRPSTPSYSRPSSGGSLPSIPPQLVCWVRIPSKRRFFMAACRFDRIRTQRFYCGKVRARITFLDCQPGSS